MKLRQLDVTAVFVLGVDESGTIRSASPCALECFGVSRPGDVIGSSLGALQPASASDLVRTVAEVRADRQSRCVDDVIVAHDGRELSIAWKVQYSHECAVGGNLIMITGAEKAGRVAKEAVPLHTFRTVIDNMSQAVMITDPEHRILYCNPAVSLTTGYSLDELYGQTPAVFKSGRTPDETYHSLARALEKSGVWRGEFINLKKNGEEYVEEMHVGVIRDDIGTVKYLFSVAEERGAREQFERSLDQLATFDQLTGLPNRSSFLWSLSCNLDDARRTGRGAVVLHLDLDEFFKVNEILSSEEADRVLVDVGARIKEVLRQGDLTARLAGDEFAVLLASSAGCSEAEGAEIAERLVREMRKPFIVNARGIELTASVGIARFPADADQAEVLLLHAMTATARVKSDGGDAFMAFDASMVSGVVDRREILHDLRLALVHGEFLLFYQPQVSLLTGDIIGLEALIRWRHPVRGMVPPGEFIPLAEESGLIVGIGGWVLQEACRQVREWVDDGMRPVKVAINLSPRQFRVQNLYEQVAECLSLHGIEPQLLEIEITEGAMMRDVGSAIRTTLRLKDLGVGLSLDDFGTGYSSLAYLSRFPIDVVKIDQSFVRDITENPANAAVAQATIVVSHKLGKAVLAEGVETQEQMQYLRRNSCDAMQGYLFSRPLPADEITTMLKAGRKLDLSVEGGELGRPMVLLVDDEPNILAALKRTLRREGYDVLTADSGEEGLALLAKHAVQVIVSDQRMPGMSGTEFLSRVKSLHPRTVRIVLSGYAEVSAVADAINKGAVYRFMMKPWDDNQLKAEVQSALRHWREQFAKLSD